MKQKLMMILMMLGMSMGFVFFGAQNIAAQEKIAFASDRSGNFEIYVMNPDGTNQAPLTNNPAFDSNPSFSPDGAKIAFYSLRDGNQEIYVMNADGTNQIRLTNNPSGDFDPAFSPDGSKIAFRSTRDGGNQEIYVMNSDGSNQIRLTNNPAIDRDPSWSNVAARYQFNFFDYSDLLSYPQYFIQADAGSDVAVRFSLGGFKGSNPYRLPPVSQRINCLNKNPQGAAQAIQTRGGIINYEATFDFYQTTWRTQAGWLGTCRRLTLFLRDGTTQTLDFRFN